MRVCLLAFIAVVIPAFVPSEQAVAITPACQPLSRVLQWSAQIDTKYDELLSLAVDTERLTGEWTNRTTLYRNSADRVHRLHWGGEPVGTASLSEVDTDASDSHDVKTYEASGPMLEPNLLFTDLSVAATTCKFQLRESMAVMDFKVTPAMPWLGEYTVPLPSPLPGDTRLYGSLVISMTWPYDEGITLPGAFGSYPADNINSSQGFLNSLYDLQPELWCRRMGVDFKDSLRINNVRGHTHPVPSYYISDAVGHAIAFVYKSQLSVDVDGAPNAYAPPNVRAQDGSRPLDVLDDAYGLYSKPGQAALFTQPAGEFRGFYVSTVPLHTQVTNDPSDPRHYADARTFRYIVNPGARQVAGLQNGDIAYAYSTRNHVGAFGQYGDYNSKVGEASLGMALALGYADASASNGIDNREIEYAIFPHSGSPFTLDDATLQQRGSALLNSIGGVVGLSGCLERSWLIEVDHWDPALVGSTE